MASSVQPGGAIVFFVCLGTWLSATDLSSGIATIVAGIERIGRSAAHAKYLLPGMRLLQAARGEIAGIGSLLVSYLFAT
jgi:hypothetical protein